MWVITDCYKAGHRYETAAPEGSFKTMLTAWEAVCIASGKPFFGHTSEQGAVLLVDNETPEADHKYQLERFAMGLGFKLGDLPIYSYLQQGFEFDRTTKRDELIKQVRAIEPVFINFDTLISMLPEGRQGMGENTDKLGIAIGRDLTAIRKASPKKCFTNLNLHFKKGLSDLSVEELKVVHLQTLVRGHGSIVGQGCDSGVILKKISEYPSATRFCVIYRVRRAALPVSYKPIYVEMKEEKYGEGWARLEEIDPISLPPSDEAKDAFKLLEDNSNTLTSREIVYKLAFLNKAQIVRGIKELVKHKAILNGSKAQTYVVNQNIQIECDRSYWNELIK